MARASSRWCLWRARRAEGEALEPSGCFNELGSGAGVPDQTPGCSDERCTPSVPLPPRDSKIKSNMVKSRLSSKGQITVPKPVREALELHPGEEVVFELREGEVVLRPRRQVPLEALLGRLKGARAFPKEEEERRIREAAWVREL